VPDPEDAWEGFQVPPQSCSSDQFHLRQKRVALQCASQPKITKDFFNQQVSPNKRKLWPSGRVLGSRLEGRGIDPRPMLDGSGVKAMPGSILAPNPG